MKTLFRDITPALRALAALALVVGLGCVFNAGGSFFKPDTHTDMLRHISRFGILACGMTLVIITGGIDLSVGSVLGLAAVCFSLFTMHYQWPSWLAIVTTLGIGAAAGSVSGLLTARFRLQPFIATLAAMVFARGMAKAVSGGQKISTAVQLADGRYSYREAPPIFALLSGRFFGTDIFVVTILFVLVAALCWVALNKLVIGRHWFAIGGNEEAARLSGVPVVSRKVAVYVISAVLAALAGICQAADELQGDPEAGAGYELTAIAIVVIGGSNLMGGRGGILLTLLGTLTIGYVEKILSLNAVTDAYRLMITGVIIVFAVLFQGGWKMAEFLRARRHVVLTATLLTLGLALGWLAVRSRPPGAVGHGRIYVVGMSQCNLGEPWRVQMNEDIRRAAEKHPNLRVIFKDAQNDALIQRAQIEEFLSAQVDAIIVSPKEAAPLTPPIRRAYESGIPVIVLDRQILGDSYTTYISADNEKIGEAAGRWAAQNFPLGTKIVELKGLMTSTPAQQRHSGFRRGIEGAGFEIIFEADMKWLEPNARQEMASALARFPRIDLVYAHNDPGAHGAWLAARAVGREKEIRFIGIDALPQEGQVYVQKGILAASFEYPTGGEQAIEAVLKALRGESLPKQILLPSRAFIGKK